LRDLLGQQLPEMPGSNTLGAATKGSLVLWEHPKRKVDGQPMPVLAIGETGDGRTIALGVDGTHLLGFSELALDSAGRAYGALWEGLLGWLMRDPRYEGARLELDRPCVAGRPSTLRVRRLPGSDDAVSVEVVPLGKTAPQSMHYKVRAEPGAAVLDVDLDALEPGGYSARARIGASPPARLDFACERGGEAWSDSRPDPERLQRISRATGGEFVSYGEIADLPKPPSTEVAAERHVKPILPPWAWTLGAALGLGAHWVFRRRGGLA
jgi:hypothetical protein